MTDEVHFLRGMRRRHAFPILSLLSIGHHMRDLSTVFSMVFLLYFALQKLKNHEIDLKTNTLLALLSMLLKTLYGS